MIKLKLKQILDDRKSNKNHIENIMNLLTLKDAHIYCKINNFTGQTTGPLIKINHQRFFIFITSTKIPIEKLCFSIGMVLLNNK